MSARAPVDVCIITAGHLSTCPRMVKAADALAFAGYHVHVVSTCYLEWGEAADAELLRQRGGAWGSTVVRFDWARGAAARAWSALRVRAARQAARLVGTSHLPLAIAARGFGRFHSELLRAARAVPARLYYGGTAAGLAVAEAASRDRGVPFALDLEDFHSAEQDDCAAARRSHALIRRIESQILRSAAFCTAGSQAMADEYHATYRVRPTPIHNTFPLPERAPDLSQDPQRGLRIYWFSQTVGPGRGLEDAIVATGLAGIRGELHLRGVPVPGYINRLQRLIAERAPQVGMTHHLPATPDPVDLCRGYDVGLALEQTHVRNRELCLTNKSLTYPLAGLAVVYTDTPGQRPLALDLGEGALLVRPGDITAFAEGLRRWVNDRALLARAKSAAWEAARRRWHWEHANERGALLGLMKETLGARRIA